MSAAPLGALEAADPVAVRRKRGRRKNTPAMTLAELGQHIARVGSRMALARALPCSRSTLYAWAKGAVNIPAKWAERIQSAPAEPRRLTKAELAEAEMRARQLVLPLGENAGTTAPISEARA